MRSKIRIPSVFQPLISCSTSKNDIPTGNSLVFPRNSLCPDDKGFFTVYFSGNSRESTAVEGVL